MGSADSKLNFRKAVIQLTTKTQPVEATDDAFWDQFWADSATSVQDVFALVPAAEIRAVREESPSNLATLCYKAVEKLVQGAESGCHSEKEKQIVLNCSRLLTRVLPYIFEDPDWRGFFWSTVPGAGRAGVSAPAGPEGWSGRAGRTPPSGISSPEGTSDRAGDNGRAAEGWGSRRPPTEVSAPVQPGRRGDKEGSQGQGVAGQGAGQLGILRAKWAMHTDPTSYLSPGFVDNPHKPNYIHDMNRTELLKLLLTCFSEAMYLPPAPDSGSINPWVQFFCSTENRHALPLFTSLLNTVCAYDPVGYGIPYNHLLFSDYREPLVEEAAQVLIVTLDHDSATSASPTVDGTTTGTAMDDTDPPVPENLFVNYLSRIHREEVSPALVLLGWILGRGMKESRAEGGPDPTLCHVTSPVSHATARVGLMHIGVFILLLLSGERNFGVRLNKPYSVRVPMDIPVFTGTHADLLIVVFHKIITSGHQRLQPLFDCLLTIVVNVSPYLKSLSMVAANKLLHLLEAFSTTWFLFSAAQNHHLVFFLLEVFNNIIQYQFDGNSNLVYAIIRKRSVFHQLANLPTDPPTIHKALQRRRRAPEPLSRTGSQEGASMEGSHPAAPAEPGTLKTSLVATPGIDKLTEKSQVSEDGTLRSLEPEPQQGSADGGSASGETGQVWREQRRLSSASTSGQWSPTSEWVLSWKSKLPLQTIMRLLQVLVPQVEKICIDKGLTDESEILRFLQHGTLVGLLPVPHPILIRKYQANSGTAMWFRTYMWGVIYLRNVDPPVWYDTNVKLFEIQRV
nr:protein HID1 [Loxodonta africana]